MKKNHKKKQLLLKSQKGFLTMDYLFAFVLVSGFFAILFTFSFTLSVAEISQYITFASARSYMASHKSDSAQKNLAEMKFNSLVENSIIKPLFKSGWFDMTKPDIGHISDIRFPGSIPANSVNRDLFWGVGTEFQSKILDFRIPFYGSTTSVGTNKGKSGFRTFISSYLGRESTWDECIQFNSTRCQAIKGLHSGVYRCSEHPDFLSVSDNGC